MIQLADIQNLLGAWWFDYDQGNFDLWDDYFTADAHFSCRSDSGQTEWEDFIRADISGRDALLAWQKDHRINSPYPLRHNGTNLHITSSNDDAAEFRSYLFVSHIVGGAVAPLSTGLCIGGLRVEAWGGVTTELVA